MAEHKASSIVTGYSGLTPADIAGYTNKSYSAADNALIASMIKALEATFVKQCDRNFAHGDEHVYYQTLDAGENHYSLFNYPVKEIRKIVLDDDTKYDIEADSNDYTLNTDFSLYDDYIDFITVPYAASNNNRALAVHYTIDKFWDDDVLLAIKQYVADEMKKRQYGGRDVRSFSFSGLSITFAGGKMPSYIQSVIDTYQKVLI
jgi:hypothetical protein